MMERGENGRRGEKESWVVGYSWSLIVIKWSFGGH